MNKTFFLFRSFRFKITMVLVVLMVFAGAVSSLLIYEYSLKSQFESLRDKVMVIAETVALSINADTVLQVPLDKNGVNSPQYKDLAIKLSRIKNVSTSIVYIYIMKKTDKEGILRFVIDLYPGTGAGKAEEAPALPGQGYNASAFPELLSAFRGPSADKKMAPDRWGVFLSGYAPILDAKGDVVAILGIDMSAKDVYLLRHEVRKRVVLVLLLGLVLSIVLGTFISSRVTSPVKKLVEGTRHIASGDLGYRVEVKSADEISELAGAFNQMTVKLYKARRYLVNYFYRVVQSLVRALEARDPYTRGHSDRVSEYSRKIALKMGLGPEKVELIKEAALMHDIGKLGIEDMILYKKSELTPEERKTINKHPAIGEEILKPISLDKEMLKIVRSHHERYDGKGYPDGQAGDKIDPLAAIVSVADSYDAMVSHRAYRKDLTKEEAIEQLKKCSGAQFNPKVVDAFLEVLKEGG